MSSATKDPEDVPAHRRRLLFSLGDGAALMQEPGPPVYIRWSSDIAVDLDMQASLDDLTGVELPGLAVQPLALESWWGDRPAELWLARKLGGNRPPTDSAPAVRPWVITGDLAGQSPDGELLLINCDFVATVTDALMDQAATMLEGVSHRWAGLGR